MRVPYADAPDVLPSGPGNDYQQVTPTPEAAGSQVAGALEKMGGALEQHALAFRGLQNETAAKDADIKFAQQLDDLQYNPQSGLFTKHGKDAVDAYQNAHSQVMALYQQARAQLGNSQAQEMFDNVATRRAIYAQGDMSRYVAQENKAWQKDTGVARINLAINESGNHWNDDNSFARSVATIRDEADQLADLEGMHDPAERKVLESHYVSEAYSARIRSVMNVDANAGMKMLDAAGDDIDAPHRAALQGELQNKQYTQEVRADAAEARALRLEMKQAAEARVGINHNLKAASDMIADGKAPDASLLPTPVQIHAAFPEEPDREEEMQDYVEDIRQSGKFIGQLPSMSPADIAKRTQELAPDPSQPADYSKRRRLFSIWSHAVDGYQKSLQADPAAVTASAHPEVSSLWSAAASEQNGFKPETFEPYAQATLGAQAVNGLPSTSRAVLPTGVAQNLASSIVQSAETAPAKIKQLMDQTGTAWPNVWHDLVTLGGLPPAYQSVAVLDNERDAALLARGINEQGKSGKDWSDIIGTPDVTAIKNGVRSDPEAVSLYQSLQHSGTPLDQIDGIMKSIDTLAYAKMFYDKMDRTSAIGSAINAFTSKYVFMPQGGARVPAKIADLVQANAEQTLQGLDPSKLRLPPLVGQPRMPSAEDYLRTVRAAPTWITAPKADGIRLLDPEGRYVLNADGTPVTVPFAGLTPPPEAPPSFRSDVGEQTGMAAAR